MTLPGVPLTFGFDNWRPGDEMRLSPEAQQRVNDKIDAVQEARRKAMESWHTYVIG